MPSNLLGFCLASLAIIVVPGPSVLFAIARGIAWGRGVAVLSVAGNSLGLLVLSGVVAVGLGPLLTRSVVFTHVVEVAGGAYLLWLGGEAIAHRRAHAASLGGKEAERPGLAKVVRQGFVVGVLNPKALVFFIAVFPHFVNRAAGNVTAQLAVLGVVFSTLALLSDGAWGFAAGSARAWLVDKPHHLVTLRTVGGVVMTGLGALIVTTALL